MYAKGSSVFFALALALAGALGLTLTPKASRAADAPAVPAPAYAPRPRSGTLGRIERLDPALDGLLAPDARIEVIAEGFDWAEGPVWFARGDFLVFSDVPRNVVWKWRPFEGLSEYLNPSGFTPGHSRGDPQGSNGLTLDDEGRLILCQHGNRQVARLKRRTVFEPLATNFEGLRLNSPNDVVLRSNGDTYFTDPPYGLAKGLDDPRRELTFQGVFRVSRRGRVTLLARDLTWPNGLAFSPDEKRLYVAVSDPERAHYMAYDVDEAGLLANGRVLFDATPRVAGRLGLPDGLKVDVRGNLWATGPGGVLVITPEGHHLGTIDPGVATANCAWGGNGTVLYLTAHRYLCRIQTRSRGRIPGPLPEIR